jgi:nuclear GTP-binding protein
MKENCPHKHMVLVLNKCDLVPVWSTKKWLYHLSQEFPIVAIHASITKPFGKGTLIQLLRQFQKIHADKPQISVGFIGYPNVGKSSIINTLKSKKVCKVAPLAGETKVWQYITLMRRIYLIDCPGVVYPYEESNEEKVLKGVVRVELIENPEDYIEHVLARVKKQYMAKTYKIEDWVDGADFLTKMAQRTGKLLKGGEPDLNATGRMVLNDWQRGKLPYFTIPPGFEAKPIPAKSETPAEEVNKEGSVKVKSGKLEKPHLIQNLNKILVQLDFGAEDMRPLDETSKDENLEIFDSDNEDEDADDDEADEGIEVEVQKDGSAAADKSDASSYLTDSDEDDAGNKSDDSGEAKPYVKLPKGPKAKGRKNTINLPPQKSKKRTRDAVESEDAEDEIPNKRANSRKRAGVVDKLTSKQKRKKERENKRKKVGSNFYEVTNVKNRNRDRKVPKQNRLKPKY